jgi:hypothetical protein
MGFKEVEEVECVGCVVVWFFFYVKYSDRTIFFTMCFDYY